MRSCYLSISLSTLAQNAFSPSLSDGFGWNLDPMILGWWGIWGASELGGQKSSKGLTEVNIYKSINYFFCYQMQWLLFIVVHSDPLLVGCTVWGVLGFKSPPPPLSPTSLGWWSHWQWSRLSSSVTLCWPICSWNKPRIPAWIFKDELPVTKYYSMLHCNLHVHAWCSSPFTRYLHSQLLVPLHARGQILYCTYTYRYTSLITMFADPS